LEACIAEISGEDRVELGRKIGRSDHGLHAQRRERVHVVLRDRHDGRVVFPFPAPHDLGLALAALDHEGWSAVRVNEVATALGQHRNLFLVGRHHGFELVLGAAPDVEKKRNEADPFGKQANDFLGDTGTHGRIDHSDDAAPAGKRHAPSPSDYLP
jgi:hypothetical protein